jgi:hypothetical protein
MKKILVFFVVACFSLTQLLAQESTFNKGDKVLNLGLGIGSSLYSTGGIIPPLSASLEVGVVDNIIEKGVIGVGGYLGFASYGHRDYYKVTNIIIGPRGTFHYPFVDKLDTYAGLMIGYNVVSYHWTGMEGIAGSSSGLVSSFFIGGRYYFSDSMAAMLELGYGIAYLNVGVAFKF